MQIFLTPATFESSVATVLVGNKRVLDAVHADPTAHARFSTFQAQHPNDTTVAVVVNGSSGFKPTGRSSMAVWSH